jgi:hypothetical protein
MTAAVTPPGKGIIVTCPECKGVTGRRCHECQGQGGYVMRACPRWRDSAWDYVNGMNDRDGMICSISCGYHWTADDPGWCAQVLARKALQGSKYSLRGSTRTYPHMARPRSSNHTEGVGLRNRPSCEIARNAGYERMTSGPISSNASCQIHPFWPSQLAGPFPFQPSAPPGWSGSGQWGADVLRQWPSWAALRAAAGPAHNRVAARPADD